MLISEFIQQLQDLCDNEGDIISSPHFERVATVKWDDSLCGFKCSDVTGNINFSFTAIAHCSEWSIVGNKFDKKK